MCEYIKYNKKHTINMLMLPHDYFKYDIYNFAYFVLTIHLIASLVALSISEIIFICTLGIDRESQISLASIPLFMMLSTLLNIHSFHRSTLNGVNSGLEVYMRNTRKKKAITILILGKKTCPDMERLISEYL